MIFSEVRLPSHRHATIPDPGLFFIYALNFNRACSVKVSAKDQPLLSSPGTVHNQPLKKEMQNANAFPLSKHP